MNATDQVAWWYAKDGKLFGPVGFTSHLEAIVDQELVDHVKDKKLARLALKYWRKYEEYEGGGGYGDEDFAIAMEEVEEIGHDVYKRAAEVGLVRIVWPGRVFGGREFNVQGRTEDVKKMMTSSAVRQIIKDAEMEPEGTRFIFEIGDEVHHSFVLPMQRREFSTWLSKL